MDRWLRQAGKSFWVFAIFLLTGRFFWISVFFVKFRRRQRRCRDRKVEKPEKMSDNKIDPIPELPPQIVDAINNDQLVVFIGAGASRLVGCTGWDELARRLVKRCYDTKMEDGTTCINFKEKETLLLERDHKKTITMCYGILKQKGFEEEFFEEFDKALRGDDKLLATDNIYDQLAKMKAVFVTTNADEYFDKKDYFHEDRIFHKLEDLRPSNIEPRKLFHIHGINIKEYRESLVFTVERYVERYNSEDFKNFLRDIFKGPKKYVVLFVGYGMSEFELIDYLIHKTNLVSQSSGGNVELGHFILLPYYGDETNLREIHQHYYRHLNIQVVPYQKDEKGYAQLYEVIKKWNAIIQQVTNVIPSDFQKIDEFTDSL